MFLTYHLSCVSKDCGMLFLVVEVTLLLLFISLLLHLFIYLFTYFFVVVDWLYIITINK